MSERTVYVQGPVNFTYRCGHAGVIKCIETTQEHVEFMSTKATCPSCRTALAAQNLYGIDLKKPKVPLPFTVEGIIETEDDGLPALASENDLEPTHMHCADCSGLFLIEDLALQADDRRTCQQCSDDSIELAELRRQLEDEGQTRLF